jgi:hypothetical protein
MQRWPDGYQLTSYVCGNHYQYSHLVLKKIYIFCSVEENPIDQAIGSYVECEQ